MALPKSLSFHDPECRYVRRMTDDKWEYGLVVRHRFDEKPKHVSKGVCETYEEACHKNHMVFTGFTHTPC